MLYSFSRPALSGVGSDTVEAAALEQDRLQAASRFGDVDVDAIKTLRRTCEIASRIAGTPFAACTLLAEEAVRVAAAYGFDEPLLWPRTPGLCATTIALDRPRVIERADLDRRTCLHPLVTGELGVRFYLGVPLRTTDGYNVGTLCAFDQTARSVDSEAIAAFEALADVAMHVLEHAADVVGPLDGLTGLPGRRLFEERIARHTREENWGRSWGAIAVIGVDGLSSIEELSGLDHRERAVCAISEALRATLEGEGDLFRVADDEFAVVAGVAATYELSRLRLAIDQALQTVRLAGFSQARARVGTATYDETSAPRDAYRLADWRMYAERVR